MEINSNICETMLSTSDENTWKALVDHAVQNKNFSVVSLLKEAVINCNVPCIRFILQDQYRGHLDITSTDMHEVIITAAEIGDLSVLHELLKQEYW